MKILHSIILGMLPIMVLTCTTVKEQTTVFPTVGEYYRWEMRDFIKGVELSYQVEDSSIFKLEESFHQIGKEDIQVSGLDVIAFKTSDLPESDVWTNQFAILGREESETSVDWVIYYTDENLPFHKVPEFKNRISFKQNNSMFRCYDLEYINKNTFIIDCMEKQDYYPGKNFIVFVKKDETISIQEVPNHKGYDIVSARKILYYELKNNDGKSQPVLLRGQYTYATPNHDSYYQDDDCQIELLLFNENNEIADDKRILNKDQLTKDLHDSYNQDDQLKFFLVDFKIMSNGDIYVLDAFKGIYIYQITKDLRWKFVDRYSPLNDEDAYGFDVSTKVYENGETHVHIVVLHFNMLIYLIDGKFDYVEYGSFWSKYPISINYSGEFIVINNSDRYQLFTKQDGYISGKSIVTQKLLVHPFQPDLITVSSTLTQRFEIGYPKISVYPNISTQKENIIYFSAIDRDYQTCQASFKYKIIQKADTEIYEDQVKSPQIIIPPSGPIIIEGIAKGPGLIYSISNEIISKDVTINLNKIQDLNIIGLSLPIATDVTYGNILVNLDWSDKTKFWFFYQLSNKQVEIYDCSTESVFSSIVYCTRYSQFKLSKLLDSQKSQIDWAQDDDELSITFMQNNYEINFIKVNNGKAETKFVLSYEKIVANHILSFKVLKQFVFVVLQNLRQVDIWKGQHKYYSIDQSTITLLGSDKLFKPKKIFSNSALKRDFILIQSLDCIFFGLMKNDFYLIFEFPILKNSQVEVYLGKKTIFIIQKNNDQFKIDEWNYENLNNIYFMKSLPFYNRYEIQSPLKSDYCFESGFLFIQAFDSQLQQHVILVYQSQVLIQESLHRVIETNLNFKEDESTIMSAAGNEQMFLYFNDNQGKQRLISFLQNTILTFAPTIESKQYFTQFNLVLNITNQDNEQPKQFNYPIKFVNTQIFITINQTNLQLNNELKFKNTTQEQYINIIMKGSQNGQVIKYFLNCQQCNQDYFKILNPIQQQNDRSLDYKSIDSAIATKNGMIFQAYQELVFYNSNGDFAGQFYLPTFYHTCISTASENGEFVFTGCLDPYYFEYKVAMYLSFCDGKSCVLAENIEKIKASYISKLLYKDGLLFIFDNDFDYEKQEGSIKVLNVNLDIANKKWKLDGGVNINSVYLHTQGYNPFKPADFDVIKYEIDNHQYFKILITSNTQKIYFVDLYLGPKTLKLIQNDNFELHDFISRKFALDNSTQFLQARVLKSTIQDDKLLCTALISTSNFATYAITFTFDISDLNNEGAPVANTAQVPFILSNYGNWKTLNKLDVLENYATLIYEQDCISLIAVYKLPSVDHTSKIGEVETQTVTFFAGEKFDSIKWSSNRRVLTLQLESSNKILVLYTNLFNKTFIGSDFGKHQISEHPQLLIRKGNFILEQDIKITVANDFTADSGVLKLTQLKETDENEEKSFQFIISALLALTMIGFF